MPSPSGKDEAKPDASWEALKQFTPAGLRVLVVDDDKLCLKVIAKMLQQCNYDVVTCSESSEALSYLRDEDNHFDLVLSDVVMPDINGFKLLEMIGLEMDVPVIMMSYDGDTNTVLKGVTHGAVDFLIKPVRLEELSNMWQHVVRRRKLQAPDGHEGAAETGDGMKRCSSYSSGDHDAPSAAGAAATDGTGSLDTKKRAHEDRDRAHLSQQHSKRPRVHWSSEMHTQFVSAVNKLGIDKAVPKKILELMTVEGLTRENVASHLQKYRLYLKKASRMDGGASGSSAQQTPSLQAVNGVPQNDAHFSSYAAPATAVMLPGMHHMGAQQMTAMPGMYPVVGNGFMPGGWQQPMMATPMATPMAPGTSYQTMPHQQFASMGCTPMLTQPMTAMPGEFHMPTNAAGVPYHSVPVQETAGQVGQTQASTLPPLSQGRGNSDMGMDIKQESFDAGGISGMSGMSGLSGDAMDDAGVVDMDPIPEEMDELLSILAKDAPSEI